MKTFWRVASTSLLTAVARVSAQSCLVVSSDDTLEDDFPCNCTGMEAAIEVQGPATLDLNGYTVSCAEGEPGAAIVQLTGSGATLLNGVVNGDDSRGSPCVSIEGPLATVKEVTIADCKDDCMVIVDGATDATVVKNWIKACDGDGITVGGENTEISYNRLEVMEENGIELQSSRNQVTENTLIFADKSCIAVSNGGDDNYIFANDLTYCGRDNSNDLHPGIVILGGSNGNQVVKNIIDDSGDDGIRVSGDENFVAENEITKSEGSGIHVTTEATENTVNKNIIRSILMYGISVAGDSNKFNQNKISLVEMDGIDVQGDFNSFFGNDIQKTLNDGIEIDGSYNTAIENTIRDTTGGFSGADGIEIDGDHNILKHNDMFGITDDCIQIDADNTTVVGNVMKMCGDDGIKVEGNLNVIKRNWVESCNRDLYDENNNDCDTNTWKNNKAKKGVPECTLQGFKNDW